MKKSYLMIAAAAALLTACSDSEKLTNEFSQPTQNNTIGFVTYSEKTTRADQSNSVNLYDFYKTFDVYSWKTVEGTTSSVFEHTPVEYFTTDTQGDVVYHTSPAKPSDEWGAQSSWATNNFKGWFYESIRYWDKLATAYSFFAIAPYEATPDPALTVTNNSTNIAIGDANDYYDIRSEKNLAIENSSIINEKRYFGFTKDYMLADKSATKNQLVTLTFHHILTKLNVKVFIQDTYTGKQEVTIKDLKIVGLENNGYFAYNTNMTTNGWTTKAGTTDNTYELEIPEDYPIKNNATKNYSGYYWIQTLVFPQTLTCKSNKAQSNNTGLDDKYLYIEYTIGSETYKAYYDLCYTFNNSAKPISAAVNYTQEEADAYNAEHNLTSGQDGFVTTETVKVPAVTVATTYPLAQGSEYTLNIKVGPEPIVFDAEVNAWDNGGEHDHVVY
jgi:hypothetical protein